MSADEKAGDIVARQVQQGKVRLGADGEVLPVGITPGPWKLAHIGSMSRAQYVHDTADRDVAKVSDRAECDANARAIAALPDLLAALADSLDTLEGVGVFATGKIKDIIRDSCDKARAALAKVEGR
jgi:hypothetical protein